VQTAGPTVLYIGAHDVDFLVRAGGTLARYAREGSRVVSVSLTYGERQESARLWAEQPDLTVDEVKQFRREECERCAALIGSELLVLDWDDGPIVVDRVRLLELAGLIQEVRPQIVITHWIEEEGNQDHLVTGRAVIRAVQVAGAAGTKVETGRETWAVGALYYSEPGFPFPDASRFRPNVWVDITDVYESKLEGLRAARSHGRLDVSYPMCAQFRGYQARLSSGDEAIQYAEAFMTERPWVGERLPFEG
jgi:4-oxalomesaconate hydratase